jgi:hypothetical protein
MTFARPTPEQHRERRSAERAANIQALCKPSRTLHTGSYSGGTSGTAIAKEEASQSGAYMAAAKALGYCMRCGLQVEPRNGLLDFCHADLGKGQGIKTDVRLGWPGCRKCHEIVGRELLRPVRRAVEYLLGVMTRAAVIAAGTWPKRLQMWKEGATS